MIFSVGCLEFFLPTWISSTQSGLHWNFLHGADGIHIGGRLVFRGSRWSSGHLHGVEEDWWRFRVSFWIARLLYCWQLNVPTVDVLLLSDGRH